MENYCCSIYRSLPYLHIVLVYLCLTRVNTGRYKLVVLKLLLLLFKQGKYIVDYREDVIKYRGIRFKGFSSLSNLREDRVVLLKVSKLPNQERVKIYFLNNLLVIVRNSLVSMLVFRVFVKPVINSLLNVRYKSSFDHSSYRILAGVVV